MTLAKLPPDQARMVLSLAAASLKAKRATSVPRPPYMWQVPPPKPWARWFQLGGRGTGKTEGGARYMDSHAKGPACLSGAVPHRMALIAPSHDDAVDTGVRGETGLLSVNRSIRFTPGALLKADLTWPNGAEAELFGAFTPEDVERFRGPQHCLAWGDEIGAWRKLDEIIPMMEYGLRLGPDPHAIFTTTPRRRALLKALLAMADTVVTKGKTSEATGLPPDRVAALYARYGGTTMGRQELDAEIIEDVDGALWTRGIIRYRPAPLIEMGGKQIPNLARIVVAIDPAVTSGPDSDDTGIVVAALGHDGYGYVLNDLTTHSSPIEWARRGITAMGDYGADRIVAEANNGGDLVSTVINSVDPNVPVTLVHAARGKRARAEPISALYEQGRIFHVSPLPELEDSQCAYTGAPGEESPDRLDALVWALSELFGVQLDGQSWGVGGKAWGS